MGLDGTLGPDARDPDTSGAGSASSRFPHLLFVWLSPSFPVGAFAYSQGLEQAAERGLLRSQADLEDWVAALLTLGSIRADLLLLAESYRATVTRDYARLQAANALALALQPSAERFLETTQQGRSFWSAVETAWPHRNLSDARAALAGEVAYPVAVGAAAAAHGIDMAMTLEATAFAAVGNLTSAAIRLGIVGQTGAQAILAALAIEIGSAARFAATGTLDDMGYAAFSADLCSIEHETQYSRLFRS